MGYLMYKKVTPTNFGWLFSTMCTSLFAGSPNHGYSLKMPFEGVESAPTLGTHQMAIIE
jgi:hypothetical protein